MRLATLATPDGRALGAVVADEVIDVTAGLSALGVAQTPRAVTEVIHASPSDREALRGAVARLTRHAPRQPLERSAFVPPHLPRCNVVCVGVNYAEHLSEAEQSGMAFVERDAPTYFSKDPRAFCGAYDDIVVDPELTQMLDWEAELAVVIGRSGRNIPVAEALDHVFGYTVVNDVSARDVQAARGQWFLGKNLEASSPIGPCVVTADEVGDPQDLTLVCTVDGEVKQQASTRAMVHSVAALVADLSRFLELRPGDVISTGTPSGVGAAATPPQFLRDGSRLVTEIPGVGRQENVVREASREATQAAAVREH